MHFCEVDREDPGRVAGETDRCSRSRGEDLICERGPQLFQMLRIVPVHATEQALARLWMQGNATEATGNRVRRYQGMGTVFVLSPDLGPCQTAAGYSTERFDGFVISGLFEFSQFLWSEICEIRDMETAGGAEGSPVG